MTAITATARISPFTVRFSHDAEDIPYPWLVVDPDGDVADQFGTRAEAYRDAGERLDAWRAEREAEQLATLQADVSDLAQECEDAALLRQVMALLLAARIG